MTTIFKFAIYKFITERDFSFLLFLQELDKLLDILKHTHELLSKDISIDSFGLMLNEMQENLSIVSFSSRLASQVWKIFFLLLIILGISRVVWINSYLCSIFFFHEFATIVFMHYIWIFIIRLLKFPCCGIYYKKKYFLSPHYFPIPEFD